MLAENEWYWGITMKKAFEDEFMEFQTGLIKLCMEVTKLKVDKIYAYASNEKKSKMFNAFFEVNGEIKTLNLLDIPDDLAWDFLKTGTNDLEILDAICEKHSKPSPTELKLFYDIKTGKFDAQYKYKEVCSAKTGKAAGDVFEEWMEEF